jgi:hypothetical protein
MSFDEMKHSVGLLISSNHGVRFLSWLEIPNSFYIIHYLKSIFSICRFPLATSLQATIPTSMNLLMQLLWIWSRILIYIRRMDYTSRFSVFSIFIIWHCTKRCSALYCLN